MTDIDGGLEAYSVKPKVAMTNQRAGAQEGPGGHERMGWYRESKESILGDAASKQRCGRRVSGGGAH